MKIKWYKTDPRFAPGTTADIGDIRLMIRKTDRKANNKWCLYMAIRTRNSNGTTDDLKREVCVARWSGNLSLGEARRLAEEYLLRFIGGMIRDVEL